MDDSTRFTIEGEIGQGNYGTVYLAFDKKREIQVALKVLHRLGPDSLRRFNKEFRLTADIHHTNIVELYDFVTYKGARAFTMEYVDGVSFLRYVRGSDSFFTAETVSLAKERTFDAGERTIESNNADRTLEFLSGCEGDVPTNDLSGSAHSLPIAVSPGALGLLEIRLRCALLQLIHGIAVLHSHRRIHRDLKPTNVLVAKDGTLKILDFGMIYACDEKDSAPEGMAGTLPYIAPEAFSSREVCFASDWYSAGVMIYEILAGHWPIQGSLAQMMEAKRTADPAPICLPKGSGLEDIATLTMELLQRDPVARPNDESLLELARKLWKSGVAQPSASVRRRYPVMPVTSDGAPFVGRKQELETICSAYESVRVGGFAAFYVSGESGLGKTALVTEFLNQCASADAPPLVLSGRCYEREAIPYKAFDSLMDTLAARMKRFPPEVVETLVPTDVGPLVRVFPILESVKAVARAFKKVQDTESTSDLATVRYRAFVAFRELIANLARKSPVIIFVDDLQWGDMDSAALLSHLMTPPKIPHLLLLLAYRGGEVEHSPVLQYLLSPVQVESTSGIRWMDVKELSPADAEELCRSILPSSRLNDARLIANIVEEGQGSPLFVREMISYVREHSGEELETRVVLKKVLLSWLEELSDVPKQVLKTIAVAGKPLRCQDLRRATALENRDVFHALRVLGSRHLIRHVNLGASDYEAVVCYHDRVRESVLAHLQPGEVQDLHCQLGLALEAEGELDYEALLVHFLGGGMVDKVARYAIEAAERAEKILAFERAAEFYGLAIDANPDETTLRTLRLKRAETLINSGRLLDAAKLFLDVADSGPCSDEMVLRRRAAHLQLLSGYLEEGLKTIAPVLKELKLRLPPRSARGVSMLLLRRAELRCRGFWYRRRKLEDVPPKLLERAEACYALSMGLSLLDPLRGVYFSTLSSLYGLATGHPPTVVLAGLTPELVNRAAQRKFNSKSTMALMYQAESLVDEVGTAEDIASMLFHRAFLMVCAGKFRHANDLSREAVARLRDEDVKGLRWHVVHAQLVRCASLLWLGDWRKLEEVAVDLVAESRQRGDLYGQVSVIWFVGTGLIARGKLEQARDYGRNVLSKWPHRQFHQPNLQQLWVECECFLHAGEGGRAWDRLQKAWPRLEESKMLKAEIWLVFATYLRARCALGAASESVQPGAYLREAERSAKTLGRLKGEWPRALECMLLASATGIRGDRSKALELFTRAARSFGELEMALHSQVARRYQGEILGSREGQALVEEADQWMAKHGYLYPVQIASLLGGWIIREQVDVDNRQDPGESPKKKTPPSTGKPDWSFEPGGPVPVPEQLGQNPADLTYLPCEIAKKKRKHH